MYVGHGYYATRTFMAENIWEGVAVVVAADVQGCAKCLPEPASQQRIFLERIGDSPVPRSQSFDRVSTPLASLRLVEGVDTGSASAAPIEHRI